MRALTNADLEAYLNEELAVEEASSVEEQIREEPELKARLLEILARRDAGVHSLGEIWRRHRVTCPTRPQLQQYLLGVLPSQEEVNYITFHLEQVGCRICAANLADLIKASEDSEQTASEEQQKTRRRKYFQSSVGRLRKAP
ncbi:hypothetical protein [Blastopirellula marina]|uniref:Uncharacterized protein n=1 Tax=Blastopirellula marina TaxID=124 RepID=A0A2S8FHC7_9BACT|nr:hypothetical protein [Blastopirellula marina]PQO31591.1 hypothetical protein C5Y98_19435 [Blastopirellula marina]PTL42898.1 hypothetical protein C5Y97_19445 [Blastopirellula marina]